MATWISHLRIAEGLLDRGFPFDPEAFLVGNIAPDSGVPNEDWSAFDPPTKVTHWEDENGEITPESFYDCHVAGKSPTDTATSFLIGYYFHLLTDLEWVANIWRPKKTTPLYREGLEKDPQFIWEIKKDWYGLDFLYLRDHRDCAFFKTFVHVQSVPDYLDYFPPGAFTGKVKYIQDKYLGPEPDLDRPFVYLSRQELDDYVEHTTCVLQDVIAAKGWFNGA